MLDRIEGRSLPSKEVVILVALISQ